jgi:hypothetical protein
VISDQRLDQLMAPFYLKMMRGNARRYGSRLLPALVKVGRTTTPQDILALLGDHWRTRVMGAWFAVMHDDQEVTNAVLEAMRSSLGSLDAPPLATAAVILAEAQALPVLQAYAANDLANGWGACGFVAAAIEHVGGLAMRASRPNKTVLHLRSYLRSLLGCASDASARRSQRPDRADLALQSLPSGA